jgi:hypothetical protein
MLQYHDTGETIKALQKHFQTLRKLRSILYTIEPVRLLRKLFMAGTV